MVRVGRVAVVVSCALALSVGLPQGGGPVPLHGSKSPLAQLWEFLAAHPVWAFANGPSFPGQGHGAPNGPHGVSADATRAHRGNGRAPVNTPGANPDDTADKPDQGAWTSSSRDHFDPATSKRIAADATATSDVYENTDGSFTRKVSAGPRNYKDKNGVWQPINTTLVRGADGRWMTAANDVTVSLSPGSAGGQGGGSPVGTATVAGGQTSSDLVSVTLPAGQVFGYSLSGANSVLPTVSGSTATYASVLPGTDLVLTAIPSGVKESLVLKSATAGSSWVFPLDLQGLSVRKDADGSIAVLDASGAVVRRIPQGSMMDSKVDPRSGDGAHSDGVTYSLVTVNGVQALQVSADAAWLADPARKFPVTVDPSLTSSGSTFVQTGWTGSQAGTDVLRSGSYDNGTDTAISYLSFSNFANQYHGLKMTSVLLAMHVVWSGSCPGTAGTNVAVYDVDAWNSSTQWSNRPSLLGQIMPNSKGYPDSTICGNSSANTNVGAWWTFDLGANGVAVANRWVTGGANNGLAIANPTSSILDWLKFSSYNSNYPPSLSVNYVPDTAPTVTSQYPGNAYQTWTLTPELMVSGNDAGDNWPNMGLKYRFEIVDATAPSTIVWDSGDVASGDVTVPAGVLKWGKTYYWTGLVSDTQAYSIPSWFTMSTNPPQELMSSHLSQNGGHGFDPAVGNYTTEAVDANITGVGPALSIARSYNSRDGRPGSAFGLGWSVLLDAKATEITDSGGALTAVSVTYPSGQDVVFGRNSDGTFAPPSGRFAVLAGLAGGYQLADKDGTVFTFGSGGSGVYRITGITDAQGRSLNIGYDTSTPPRAVTLTNAAGRHLYLTWFTPAGASKPHVATVYTDQAVAGDSSSVSTWIYNYSGDKLTSVCPPTSSTYCTVYSYGTNNLYPALVADAAPHTYLRLSDAANTSVAHSATLSNVDSGSGQYTNVTLGQPGPLAGSTATAASFNGTSSYVQLSGQKVAFGAMYQSVSVWFKTSANNQVLISYQADPMGQASSAGNNQPLFYIGNDGKLYGEFWQGAANGIGTSGTVTDNQWHHAVLAGMGSTQTMYLDGAVVGTLSGQITLVGAAKTIYVGAGYLGGFYPHENHYTGTDSIGYPTFFNGSIADYAFFDHPLAGSQVAAMYAAAKTASAPLTQITRPSGGVDAQISYDPANERVTQVTDANNGTWQIGPDALADASRVYGSTVISSAPVDFFRMADNHSATATNEVSSNSATYSAVTQGVANGPFGATPTVASFNGTSSYLQLPATDIPTTGPATISLWFKLPAGNSSGGVLYSYQSTTTPGDTSATSWNPGIYVGTDGKLRGQLWTGSVANTITSSGTVNDGNWHHVALAAATNTQTLYLDGAAVGSYAGTISANGTAAAFLGAGKWQTWPGAGSNQIGWWPGQIAEFAYFSKALPGTQIKAQFDVKAANSSGQSIAQSGNAGSGMAVKSVVTTDPAGNHVTNWYDMAAGGRQVATQDAGGGITNYTFDIYGFPRVVIDPNGNTTTSEHDARGNVLSKRTCQDQATNKCSTVKYTYAAGSYWTIADVITSAGDFDGDGKGDVILRRADNHALYLIAGNGQGGWKTGVPVLFYGNLAVADAIVAVKDFDGDGKPDLIYRRSDDTNLYLLKGNGSGGVTGSPVQIGSGWGGVTVLSPGDFDGDGKTDLIYRNDSSGNLYLITGNGAGGWKTQGTQIGNGWGGTMITSPGDFDGDGKADLVYYNTSSGLLYFIAGNGTGGWKTGSVQIGSGWQNNYILSARDFNGDGKSDLLYRSYDNNFKLIKGNGTGSWLDGVSYNIGSGFPDSRTDKLTSVQDGRSTGASDFMTTYGYDGFGNPTTTTDALGRVTTTLYTDGTTTAGGASGAVPPAGLPYKTTSPSGAVTTTAYSASGDVASTVDAAGLTTTYTYDPLGRPTSKKVVSDTYSSGLSTSYTYDKLSRVLTKTDPKVTDRVTGAIHTSVTTTGYDYDSHVTSTQIADTTGGDTTRTTTAHFNSLGQQDSTTDARGKTTTYTYDALGRKTSQTNPTGTGAAPTSTTTSYAYNATGQIVTTTVKAWTGDPNNPGTATDTIFESRAYDPAGRLASVTDAGGYTTCYTYTDNNLLASVVRRSGANCTTGSAFVVESDTYDAAGNLTGKVTNNGATSQAMVVDAANRVTSSTLDPNGINRATAYTYGIDDTLTSTTVSDATGSSTVDATYDLAGRKTSEGVRTAGGAASGWWKLHETSGTTATDSSGGHRNGTTAGGVTWSNNAASFNGSNAEIATAGPVLDTVSSFTVSVWANLTANSGGNQTVVSQDGSYGSGFYLRYDSGQNKWTFFKLSADNSNGLNGSGNAFSASAPSAGAWTHLVGVYDQAAGQLRLYVNGTLTGTTTAPAGFSTSGALHIGRAKWAGNPCDWFNGAISNVQVFQHALSGSDAAALFSAGRTGGSLASGITTRWAYDQRGLATSQTDPNGNVSYMDNDEAGRLASTTYPTVSAEENGGTPASVAPVTATGYNTFGEPVESKDPKGRVVVTARDANGWPTSVTLPDYTPPGGTLIHNAATTSTYFDNGTVKDVTDPLGNKKSYRYDQLGRAAIVTAPDGGITRTTLDLLGRPLQTVDPTGAVAQASYDYLSRKATTTQQVRASGPQTAQTNVTTYTYTDAAGGFLTSVKSPANATVGYGYDKLGELTSQTDPAGNVTSYGYDYAGRKTLTTVPQINAGDVTQYKTIYDAAGRPTAAQQLSASNTIIAATSATYDADGNALSTVDAGGHTTTFTYNALGWLTQQSEPVDATTTITSTFGYDSASARTRFTDGRNSVFLTTYNSWGMPESSIEPATAAFPNAADRTFTTVYDAAGRPASQTLPGGVSTTNTYTGIRLTKQSGTGAEAATADRSFGYDLAGRITSLSGGGGTNTLTYDDRGLLTQVSGPVGNSSFTYTGDGLMNSRVDAAGTTSYTYDSADRLSTVANTTTAVNATLSYNALNQPTQITYGTNNDRRVLGYDPMHRLNSDTLKTSAGATVASIGYGFDLNGNETSKTTAGFTGAGANTYTYDWANRLTSWTGPSGTTTYAYDKAGNRVQAGAVTFTYDQRNQLLTKSGGTTYAYTKRGTLASSTTGTVTLPTQSDAFGQIISQYSTPTAHSDYTYDGLGRAIKPGFAYTGTGNDLAADGTATYTRGPTGSLVGVKQGGSSTLAWTDLHSDLVGVFTPSGTSLSGSTTFDPFGKVVATSTPLGNLGYQSGFTESATGRVNMLSRWYDTDTGQFDTRDRARNSPVPDSANANRFAYGNDNPLTMQDPSGRSAFLDDGSNPASVNKCAYNHDSPGCGVHNTSKVHGATAYKHHPSTYSTHQQTAPYVAPPTVWDLPPVPWGCESWDPKYADDRACQGRAGMPQDPKDGSAKSCHSDGCTNQYIDNCDESLKCTTDKFGYSLISSDVGVGAACNTMRNLGYHGDCRITNYDAMNWVYQACNTAGVEYCQDAWTFYCYHIARSDDSATCEGNSPFACPTMQCGIQRLLGLALGTAVYMAAALCVAAGAVGCAMAAIPIGMAVGEGTLAFYANGGGGNPESLLSTADEDATVLGLQCFNSFTPTTGVLMADGTTKQIKHILVGDRVESADPLSGVARAEPVQAVHRNLDTKLADVTVRTSDGATAVIHTTQHHPFWNSTTKKWVDAGDLISGDNLQTAEGKNVKVIREVSFDGNQTMLNLTVKEIHTFFVMAGRTPVLVHNTGPCGPDLGALSAAGQMPDRAGFTVAGRSLTKHGSGARPNNSLFPQARGNPDQINQIAQFQLDDILTNPGSTFTAGYRGRFGNTIEVTAPDGRGVVFDVNGNFLFFKE